jgi:N-acetylmuramoyl-L-alanine amidase
MPSLVDRTETNTPATAEPTETPPTSVATTPDATDTIPAPTTTIPSGPPVAWIAPSGVTLAVTGVNGDVIEVLTPCGDPATITDGTPVYEVDVVIDPGHGGPVDTGAVGDNGLHEEDINLRVSLAVRDLLESRGVAALLTRTGDYPIPIRTRSEYSDLVGAEALVSIHHNAPEASPSEVPGVEIFVKSDDSESQRLGGLLYDATMASLSNFDVDWDRAPDAGVLTVLNTQGGDAYGMVRLPQAPSALLELGYIANPAEAELYTDPAYLPTAAQAVTEAVETFLSSEDTGSPIVATRIFNPQRGVGRDQCVEPDLEKSLYPDVVDVTPLADGEGYSFIVTMSSTYDSVERHADAWRVIGDDGVVYGMLEFAHENSTEQPVTRSLDEVVIPDTVNSVTVQGRDLVYGWGGKTVEVDLP